MIDIGWAVLSGIAAGALWGWHFGKEDAAKVTVFWRDQAAKLQGEHEGMLKALSQANAAREAADVALEREKDRVAVRDTSLRHLHEHIEVLESRLRDAKRKAKTKGEP